MRTGNRLECSFQVESMNAEDPFDRDLGLLAAQDRCKLVDTPQALLDAAQVVLAHEVNLV